MKNEKEDKTHFDIYYIHFIPVWASDLGAKKQYMEENNYDFVESADGIVKKTGLGLSLWTRAIALGTIAEPIMKRELFRMAYSEFLYLTSTNGEAYDR